MRDAEALLLVDDHEAEILEAHVAREDPVRAHDDVDLAGGERGDRALLLGFSAEAREPRDAHGEVGEALGEGHEVLLGEHGRGREHGRLLAAEHGQQRRAQRHLGLAVADVAADEAVHGHAVLHVGEHGLDGAGLVGRLLERERLLELSKDGVGRGEGVPREGGALGVELQQLLGDLAGLGRDAPALVGPRLAAQLVEAHGRGVAARVPVAEADAVHGHVDGAAVVLEVQEVLRHAAHDQLLEAAVPAHTVLVVHDGVALGDLAQVAEAGASPTPPMAGAPRGASAGRRSPPRR